MTSTSAGIRAGWSRKGSALHYGLIPFKFDELPLIGMARTTVDFVMLYLKNKYMTRGTTASIANTNVAQKRWREIGLILDLIIGVFLVQFFDAV